MSTTERCRQCGEEVRDDLIERLCPKCVARMTLRLESAHSGDGSSGPDPAKGSAAALRPDPEEPRAEVFRFGDYELLHEIARGGMGVVYRARQRSLDRIVAVKMLLFPKFAGPEAEARFQGEAEAAAKLQHPNIVAIHEIGEQEGQRYFSMDYVEGVNLERLARDKAIEPGRAAGYLQDIAQAVHYAHVRGVVHRDLKPSNVMLDTSDRPRITDFGLAKVVTGDSHLTMTGQVLGSPGYLPPEQTEGKGSSTGVQADVYALGAVLYYLLTRRPPFEGDSLTEVLERVRHTPPIAPRQLVSSLPRDLETICLKCLRKEPGDRYASAEALAEDLGRFLSGEPIRARPVGMAGRLWRWCRRKPALASVGAAAVLLLLTLAIGGPLTAARYRALAEEQRRLLYASELKAAQQAIDMANMGQAAAYLRRHRPARGQADLREFTWHYLNRLCRPYEEVPVLEHGVPVVYLAVTRDGKRLAVGGCVGKITIWDIESRSLLYAFNTGEKILTGPLAFSPDGRYLAAMGHGSRISSMGLQTWNVSDIPNWKRVYHKPDLAGFYGDFSPDGSLLAVPTGGGIGLVALNARPQAIPDLRYLPQSVRSARFSPDGKTLVSAGWDSKARLWDVATGELQGVFTNHIGLVRGAAHSPDGRQIASVGEDRTVRLWDASSLEEVGSYEHDVYGGALDFSGDAWLVASGGSDGLIKLWDIRANTLRTLRGHSKTVRAVKFIPGAGLLASGSMDRTVRLWDLNRPWANDLLEGPRIADPFRRCAVAFAPSEDGVIATVSSDGVDILLWDTASGTLQSRLKPIPPEPLTLFSPDTAAQAEAADFDLSGAVSDLAFSVKGMLAAARTYRVDLPDRTVTCHRIEFWDVSRGAVTNSFAGRAPVCFSRDGRVFAWQGEGEGAIHWRDLDTGRLGSARQDVLPQHLGPMGLALSSDGRTLAACGYVTVLWDTATGGPSATLASFYDGPYGPLGSFALSSDDRLLIGGGELGEVHIWDLGRGQIADVLLSHLSSVRGVAISQDARTLATGDDHGVIKLWALEQHRGPSGARPHVRELLTLQAHDEGIGNLEFSPDGHILASCGREGTVRLWRAR